MARLPPLQRLLAEDFSDQAGWIDKLIAPLNSYMERTTSALNRGLTLTDNMSATIKTVEVTGTFPIKLAWDLPARPQTVLVGNAYRSDGLSYTLPRAVSVQWSFNQAGQLQIDGVQGLLPDTRWFQDADVNTTNDTATVPAHGYTTGQKLLATSTGTLPSGLTADTAYFVIKVDEHTLKFATTYDNAIAGTAVDLLSSSGTGYHILTPQYHKKFKLTLECKTA